MLEIAQAFSCKSGQPLLLWVSDSEGRARPGIGASVVLLLLPLPPPGGPPKPRDALSNQKRAEAKGRRLRGVT